jgi:Na+-transporting NADH:ubiquinone oxidoreductase subunit NqrB
LVVAGSPSRSMASLVLGHDVFPVECVSRPITELLDTIKVEVPLWQHYGCLDMLVVIAVVHRHHTCGGLLVVSLLWKLLVP